MLHAYLFSTDESEKLRCEAHLFVESSIERLKSADQSVQQQLSFLPQKMSILVGENETARQSCVSRSLARDQTSMSGGRRAGRKEQKKRQGEPSTFSSMEFSLSEGTRCSWNSRHRGPLQSELHGSANFPPALITSPRDALSDSRAYRQARYTYFPPCVPPCFPQSLVFPVPFASLSSLKFLSSFHVLCQSCFRGFRDSRESKSHNT